MLLRSNLRLLHAQLTELAETPYFHAELDSYIEQLRQILDALLARLESVPPRINVDVAQLLGYHVWELTQFLTGSTTKQIPYEVVYAIERAASEWTSKKLLITTAIVQQAQFFFRSGSPDFFGAVQAELGIVIDTRPIQIALPYIYRHKPLFCLPLFHELGHYVDDAHNIVQTSLLTNPDDVGPDLPDLISSAEIGKRTGQDRLLWSQIVNAHRKEYFADLFSASYVGEAARGFLQEFCPNQVASQSHPATAARIAVIDDFLGGRKNAIIDLLQGALATRGQKALGKRFDATGVAVAFGNVRPFQPTSDGELFGLFQDGWQFLNQMWRSPGGPYALLKEAETERTVNDLVEKSIRNRMIVEGWREAANTR